MDVGERPRVECELGEGPYSCGCQRGTSSRVWTRGKARDFLLGPAMVQLVFQVCCSLEMLLLWWDTYLDLDESQNLITTDAPALSIAGVMGGESKERS